MKIVSIALISMLVVLTSCKDNDPTFCSTKATLTATNFSCYGIGLVTEFGDTLVAVSNLDEGHACPLSQVAPSMELGETFYLNYERGNAGVTCRIALPKEYHDAPRVWIDCLNTGCAEGQMCTQLFQK